MLKNNGGLDDKKKKLKPAFNYEHDHNILTVR